MKNSVHMQEALIQALKLSTAERLQLIERLSKSVQMDMTPKANIRLVDKTNADIEETAEMTSVASQDPRSWLETLASS